MNSGNKKSETIKSLYQQALGCVAASTSQDLLSSSSSSSSESSLNRVNCLPVQVKCDLLYRMFILNMWFELRIFLQDLPTFSSILIHSSGKRQIVHMIFQKLMDKNCQLDSILSREYCERAGSFITSAGFKRKFNFITNGYHLANFFIEAGWYLAAIKVLTAMLELPLSSEDEEPDDERYITNRPDSPELCPSFSSLANRSTKITADVLTFHIKIKLLCSLTLYSRFNEANKLAQDLEEQIDGERLGQQKSRFDICQAYNQLALFSAAQMQYKSAYKYSCLAMENITDYTPKLAIIDIFCVTSMVCLARKDFEITYYLLRNALMICDNLFNLQDGDDRTDVSRFHPSYGDLLVSWAYYYHCMDCPNQSVKLYKKALNFRRCYFSGSPNKECVNLLVATTHQELAFEYYIQEYSSGSFDIGLNHAELAKKVLELILPADHHLLASVKRNKALIIEEMAIDDPEVRVKNKLLEEAQELHLSAIEITKNILGEENLQTARHYANLGRLYQTMGRYEDSECMQLRSIEIKEKVMGKDDYEVAQSYGYLASLYNYEMCDFQKAERYHKKSIDIISRVLGPAHSGLEFGYQGLLRIYTMTNQFEKMEKYHRIIRSWESKRDALNFETGKKDPLLCLRTSNDKSTNFKNIIENFKKNRLYIA